MAIIISILFGIVEGITEWLPVSSTGHMILFNALIHFENYVSSDFYSMYEVVIQLGAILAVALLFFKALWPLKRDEESNISLDKNTLNLWLKIIISSIPAACIIPFDDYFEEMFYNPISVAIALIVFGIGFIVIEKLHKGRRARVNSLNDLTYLDALLIGCFQVLAAIFPGTSRSGATILGGLLIGVARGIATEYTFFLALPAMAGASLLKLLKFSGVLAFNEIMILLVGMISAFVVSLYVIRNLLGYVRKHDFTIFGYYRIILGIIVIIFFSL